MYRVVFDNRLAVSDDEHACDGTSWSRNVHTTVEVMGSYPVLLSLKCE